MKLLGKNKLIVQVLVAKVEDELCEVDKVCVGINQTPIINFTDGTKVVFSWIDLCNMAVDFKKEEEANETYKIRRSKNDWGNENSNY